MTKDEALNLALEALEKSLPRLAPYGEQDWLDSKAAITAIKQAKFDAVHEALEKEAGIHISQQPAPVQSAERGEPVAWIFKPNRELLWPNEVERKNPLELNEYAPLYTTPSAAPVQEPVAFLANGTRFKISYDSRQSGGQIHGIPPELGGRWVAFVAADDDCHLKLTTPPAAQRQWVGLTDEERYELLDKAYNPESYAVLIEAKLKEKNT